MLSAPGTTPAPRPIRYDDSMIGKRPLKITVELPPEAVDIDGRSLEELASGLRLLWVTGRVRAERISVGKGAELVGMDGWSFQRTLGDHGVAVVVYSAEDVRNDAATVEALCRSSSDALPREDPAARMESSPAVDFVCTQQSDQHAVASGHQGAGHPPSPHVVR